MSRSGVALLMATRNGAPFLDEQFMSLAEQTHPSIDIHVSDDGSTDGTIDLLRSWATRWSKGRFNLVSGPQAGFAENFRFLIAHAPLEADYFAFCDQDDIWERQKLALAIAWLETADASRPRLFCSRTLSVDAAGKPIGKSPLFERPPSFRNALVQSLAGGNTMVLNRAAFSLVREASSRSGFVSHDWWSYLIVTGTGGDAHYSREPLVRYRQHGANLVGANSSIAARLHRLRRLHAGQFAQWSDRNLEGLALNFDLLTDDARFACDQFASARKGTILERLRALKASGVYRQTGWGSAGLWTAIALGWL
jgi:glycosyltransferase involved in cell wall biosynthesis